MTEHITSITPQSVINAEIAFWNLPHSMEIVVPFAAKPAQRPRGQAIFKGKGSSRKFSQIIYRTPEKYRQYLEDLQGFFSGLSWEDSTDVSWVGITVCACSSFPKATPKKYLQEFRITSTGRGDGDNIIKPYQDSLQKIGVIRNDSQLFTGKVVKFRSLHGNLAIICLHGIDSKDLRLYKV